MRSFPTFALCALLSPAPLAARPQDEDRPLQAIHDPATRFALERAAMGATERLEHPECGKVLSDFRDVTGRTIREELDVLGETPRGYLARVVFREGLDRRPCRNPGILAFTSVGGREVFVCSPQLWQTYRSNPARIEALVIHEMMHTLGLGENPPRPPEIDAQILKRCR
jgi:hypothetical protein